MNDTEVAAATKLKDIVVFLTEDYKNEKDYSLIGLMGGRAGVILSQAILYKFTKNKNLLLEIEKNCDSIIKDLNDSSEVCVSYATGIAGIGWLFIKLKEIDIIPFEIDEILLEIDLILERALLDFFSESEYDLMHESLSVGLYFLKRGKHSPILKILDMLEASVITAHHEMKWIRYDKQDSNKPLIDFGLAHGNAGILYFLGKCFRNGVEDERVHKTIKGLLNFFNKNKRRHVRSGSLFPNCIPVDEYSDYVAKMSRVGWCYGDLGIVHTIHLIAKWLGDKELLEVALSDLKIISRRRGFETTLVSDPGLCHGSSGNGLIFLNLFRDTGEREFDHAARYYFEQTIQFGSKYQNTIKSYIDNVNNVGGLQSIAFLTGISGIAAYICEYLKESNLDWDEAMFLK